MSQASPADALPAPHAPARPVLSVVMPIYNEIRTLEAILERVRAVPIDKEIVAVDDGSTDGSRERLQELAHGDRFPMLRVILQERNQGKTAALVAGFREARGQVILIQDADLEYDPNDYPKLVEPILDGRADVVYGSRFTGSPRRVLMFWHTVGNRLLTLLSNAFTNLNLTDMETCYKAFRADVIQRIPIRSSGFGFEPEVTAKIARLGCRIYEVPISYSGREYWEGKKITWRDGVQALWVIVRASLAPLDDPGLETLEVVDRLHRYNRYLWQKMRPYVGARVLEIGAGTGSITRHLSDRSQVLATDTRPDYVDRLRGRFENRPNVSVRRLVLGETNPDLPKGEFDTVVCSNVLEHIEDDRAALAEMNRALVDGGRLVLVVPMLRALHGSIDRALAHHRRYEKDEIAARLAEAGFALEALAPFNVIGIFGWWLNSRVLRRRSVPPIQARINDLLVPWIRFEDRFHPRHGMSALVVGRKLHGA
jgi:glycosyltransferase involved in cell wall biosynthesis